MTIELDNNLRRALGLAVQILEDMPGWLRPESNMDDMRDLLVGKSSGRDGLIISEAIAIALAYRTFEIVEAGPRDGDVFGKRLDEFTALFAAARAVPDPRLLALGYVGMLDRLARSRADNGAVK
jgi:hypothetical protein